MSEKNKVWVIDPKILKRRKHNGRAIQREFGSPGALQTDVPPWQPGSDTVDARSYAGPGQPDGGAAERSRRESSYRKDTAPFLLLAYLLGPFSILLTQEGRKSRFWLSTALVSGIAAAILLSTWKSVSARLAGADGEGIWLILVAGLMVLAAVTAWVRGVLLIGRHRRIIVPNLPPWIRRPLMTGILGLIVPGLGLFIAGRVRRAATALWIVGTALLSAFILANTAMLRGGGGAGGSAGMPGITLEYVLLALGAMCLIGALTWIVQALDGARLAGSRQNRDSRAQGNMIAIALLAAIIVFSVMFEPGWVANALDRFAVSKHREGYRIIPLCAAQVAVRLDPSRPEYVMHAADFYESLGEGHTARAMREELYERWEPCIGMVKQQARGGPVGARSSLQGNVGLSDRMKRVIKEEWGGTWDRIKAVYGSPAILEGDSDAGDAKSPDETSADARSTGESPE